MINFYNYHNQILDFHDEYSGLLGCLRTSLMVVYDLTPIHHIIKTDVRLSYVYAHHNLRGRFIEAEPYIMKNPKIASMYADNIIKGRWLVAEPYIMKDPCWALDYAQCVIRGRWVEAEPLIRDSVWWYAYSKWNNIE